ncbi:MAG: hypothetical protein IH849_04780 [Acidobacteria bacterium]|nr:hypothetical protein [Acidobacteriota bacterium]
MLLSRAFVMVSVVALMIPMGGSEPMPSSYLAVPSASETAPQRLASPFAEGDLFPDLAFPSLEDGSPTRLSDFRGHKVMLHVFASW